MKDLAKRLTAEVIRVNGAILLALNSVRVKTVIKKQEYSPIKLLYYYIHALVFIFRLEPCFFPSSELANRTNFSALLAVLLLLLGLFVFVGLNIRSEGRHRPLLAEFMNSQEKMGQYGLVFRALQKESCDTPIAMGSNFASSVHILEYILVHICGVCC